MNKKFLHEQNLSASSDNEEAEIVIKSKGNNIFTGSDKIDFFGKVEPKETKQNIRSQK